MEKRRKKTPEERAAERAYQEDLDRRVVEAIERYRKLNAKRRAKSGEPPQDEDIDRRMIEMIERYRKLNAEKRASSGAE